MSSSHDTPDPRQRVEPAAPATLRARAPAVSARVRVAVIGLAWVALAAVVLLAAVTSPRPAHWQPRQRISLDGADFVAVAGNGAGNARGEFVVEAFDERHMAVQSHVFAEPIAAGDLSILRYRWNGFPRALELSLLFRSVDAPDDVQTITLPPAATAAATFNLASVPAWRGRISEIGFVEYPTAQLVPDDARTRPFALAGAELWSPSWRGSLAALATDWFAYRPWALMSVSALGPDAPWRHGASLVIVVAVFAGGAVAIAALVLRRSRRWVGAALCIAVGAGWLALDLRWLVELRERVWLTRQLHAGRSWSERSEIVPDRELLVAAHRVRDVLATTSAPLHVLIAAGTPYQQLRLAYHLLPFNVAPAEALKSATNDSLRGTVWLLAFASDVWRYDAAQNIVRGPDGVFNARVIIEDGDLRLFAIGAAAR